MPNEDLIMERLVERLMAQDERHLIAAARRSFERVIDGPNDYDWCRDDAIDRVEKYLFNDLRWEAVPATVISDIAHEVADKAWQER